ncbi:hypothetical protein ADN00_15800 [Ornatilinea apprima]|uniref:Uncharacterized protein n=1 Tax=Ornatilinea apprima TaxID=1134406 RepID=A0A0P6XRJ4_9CHLR|nr:hypothetical protein [Ornatilinea apprima]KPL72277.1 hypothetical protein ADN00_15800 [Ornatilinea apprima]
MSDTGSKPKNHTHSTIAGLEELTAFLLSLKWATQIFDGHLRTMQDELEVMKKKIDQALEIVNTVRKGPYAYSDDEVNSAPKNQPKFRIRPGGNSR